MDKTGVVLSICNGIAEIKITRDSACGENCSACGLCNNRELIVSLAVGPEISAGDNVKLCTDGKSILKLSALGYVTLTVLLLLGGIIGTILDSEWLAFLLSILFVLAGIYMLRKNNPAPPEIRVEKI